MTHRKARGGNQSAQILKVWFQFSESYGDSKNVKKYGTNIFKKICVFSIYWFLTFGKIQNEYIGTEVCIFSGGPALTLGQKTVRKINRMAPIYE